jgi:hypothetical protein
MKTMPQKLFDMVQQGVDEDEVQFIFDYLMLAEEQGSRFVNVYMNGETAFFSTNDAKQADQQIKFFRDKVRKPALGFENVKGDWQERLPNVSR